ncbi:hypothetical protein E1B28_005048 [Marasmius oreades]|uniref:Uncharacterized protein n=1 Tax=Marasmius oreades TaxID=181124 RepID=A0A9P7UZY9_9AGAR|nr:uncharacterized protein E1B28_005048 [Marasmius oreades]KAG7097728.1 hypothetical protein E1B28_005048 [Marasmius oreades]
MNVSGPELWTCWTCNKCMHVNSRRHHLRGKQHLKKARTAPINANVLSPQQPAQTTGPPEPPSNPPQLVPPSRPEPTAIVPNADSNLGEYWTCEDCNNRRMHMRDREPHLAGKLHKTILARRSLEADQPEDMPSVSSASPRHIRGLSGRGGRGSGPGGSGRGGEGVGRGSNSGGFSYRGGVVSRGRGGDNGSGGGGGGGGGGPGRGGGGGGGPGRGGRGRGRGRQPRYSVLRGSDAQDMIDFLAELGHGRIPGGGGCSSGDDYTYDRHSGHWY